jgi:hypothetical protein
MLNCVRCKHVINIDDKVMACIPSVCVDEDAIVDDHPEESMYCCESCWEEIMLFLLREGYLDP